MPSVTVIFSSGVTASDPEKHAVLVVGQHSELLNLTKNVGPIKPKFGNAFDEKHFLKGFESLPEKTSSVVDLWFNKFTLATLPASASRHNAPMHPHTLSNLVKTHTGSQGSQYVVIVCKREHAFALGCAVPRVFPLYNMKKGANEKSRHVIVEFIFYGENNTPLTSEEVDLLNAAGDSIRLAGRIIDAPCNEMHTNALLKEVLAVKDELDTNVKCTVIQGEELAQKGFGGIYGVGKAAVNGPILVVLSHTPPGATKTIAWCGKGIVYDTGGLSIKDKTSMPGMKSDCGGAAGILGAFRAAVKAGFKENLHAVLCLAENAVGPLATRPDDVHTLYSGLTVEINNTDAEGRLVLGDGVAYAKKDLKADIILDMATLTGAQGIATGQYHAALLTNNEAWEHSCMEAGKTSGDLVFPVPYTPELHFEEFNSPVADMKNSVKNRNNAQPSCAGLFIGSHIGFDFEGVWVHVDMAGPSRKNDRGTGYGVALLLTLFGKYSTNAMLNDISPII